MTAIVVWQFMGWNALARDDDGEFARVAHCRTKRGAIRKLRRIIRQSRPDFEAHLFVRPKGETP